MPSGRDACTGRQCILEGLPALGTQVGYGWQVGGLDVTAAGLELTVPAVPLLFALPWASVGIGKSF